MNWYEVKNISTVDSPALLLYPDRISENIRLAVKEVGDPARLRPHVKTNKIAEVCEMMMAEGITKFKCATIAEAEMLGRIGAHDVLLAYQPVGPKIARFIALTETFPETAFSCLVDNAGIASALNHAAVKNAPKVDVAIDVNIGMNRTGVALADALNLYRAISTESHLRVKGIHVYDGHIRDADQAVRKTKSDEWFARISDLLGEIKKESGHDPVVIVGGSPTFGTHAHRRGVECSPGTFVFWDYGYQTIVPEQPFRVAAVVITRIISIVDKKTICTDLGHKAIAAESPLPRAHFLNAPEAKAISQSEEHLVLEVEDSAAYRVGDVLYGVPMHICPTVALYDTATVVHNQRAGGEWKVVARDRSITI